MTFLFNKWPMEVCHMLAYWIYYINSFNFRFWEEEETFEVFGETRQQVWFVYFIFDLIYIFLVSFYSTHRFLLYYGLCMLHHPYERLKKQYGFSYIVFSFFWFNTWIFTLLWIVNVTPPPWEAKKPIWGLKYEHLKARNLEELWVNHFNLWD